MMMKKSWSRKAVSPVIATILMVAITVVLAAVLYVMVMGFGGNAPQAPAVQLSMPQADRIQASVSPATDLGNFKVTATGATAPVVLADGAVLTVGSSVYTFHDVGADKKLTSGDYWTHTGAAASGEVFTLLWVNSDTTQDVAHITVG